MDDLTVRTGRVVDVKFYTDAAADRAVRAPEGRPTRLPERGIRHGGVGFYRPKPKPESDKRAHHDAACADANHPTREILGCFLIRAVNPEGFRVVGLGVGVVGSRGGVLEGRAGADRGVYAERAGGHFVLQTPAVKLADVRSLASSVRAQVCRVLCRSGRSL